MINYHREFMNICPIGLYKELLDVVDISSLCVALNLYLKQNPNKVDSLTVKKNTEKNIIIASLKRKRKIYQLNHQLIPSPGFENFPITILFSKRRQDIIHKELMSEVLNNPIRNKFLDCGKGYDPAIHEDFAYSDENWSPKDASL